MESDNEASKLQNHLTLLREEYIKLQTRYEELNRKYQIAIGTSSHGESGNGDDFVLNLLKAVANLYNNSDYSDIEICIGEKALKAHKFVLDARSSNWAPGGLDHQPSITLDKEIPVEVGEALFRWVYTDTIDIKSDSDFLLSLLRCASKYRLTVLMSRCENALTTHVTVKSCIKFYQTANDIQALTLMNHCSDIIANHWDDFTSEDFASMPAPLLYQMFKARSRFPLHRAIKAHREDVVFLYVVEFSTQLDVKLNERNEGALLPIELALRERQRDIADALVKNRVDLNILDVKGFSLLHKAIQEGDFYSAMYLIEKSINPNHVSYEHKRSALHSIPTSPLDDDQQAQVVSGLLKLGANTNLLDTDNNTAMHVAVDRRTNGAIDTLLSASSSLQLDLKNADGFTPLSACLLGSDEAPAHDGWELTTAAKLIKGGASCNLVEEETGNTLLHQTILANRQTTSMFLVKQGANVNLPNKQGEISLHLAATHAMLDLVNLLLESGANPNAQTYLIETHKTSNEKRSAKAGDATLPPATLLPPSDPLPTQQSLIQPVLLHSSVSIDSYNPFAEPEPRQGERVESTNPFGDVIEDTTNPFGHVTDDTTNPFGDAMDSSNPFTGDNPFTSEEIKPEHSLGSRSRDDKAATDPSPRPETPDESEPEVEEITSKQSALHLAIVNQHEHIVQAILTHRDKLLRSKNNYLVIPSFILRDSKKQTPLAVALWAGLHDVAKQLLHAGCSVNDENHEGLTLLHQAIIRRDSASCIFLLTYHADINKRTRENESVMELAIRNHLQGVLTALCKKKAPVNSVTSAGDPLIWLALNVENYDACDILVKNDCDVNAWHVGPNECRETLLHRAIAANQQKHACYLIKHRCDLNTPRKPGLCGEGGDEARDQLTPLHLASARGQEEVVQTLMECNANINAQTSEGQSALHLAISNRHSTVTSLLLSHPDLDVTLRNAAGWSPFATAMTCGDNKAATAILNRAPNAADQFDNRGRNFLHVAVQKSDIESVLFLISVQADVNGRMRDAAGLTPLHIAVQTGNEMIVRNLILAGAIVADLTLDKRSALHIAAEHDHSNIARVLLENSVDYAALDNDRNNALHVAVKHGNLATVKVIVTETTIDAEAVNLKGQNALHLLGSYGKENAAAIFEVFIQAMPHYPINKADLAGNTALLLAYKNGNGQLCRSIVRAGACLGHSNHDFVNIFNAPVASRQLLTKLLDMLSNEPPWTDGDTCQQCASKFNIKNRKHHCRHCGRLLCGKCSSKDIPIVKFSLNKPVRVCDVCFDVLTLGA